MRSCGGGLRGRPSVQVRGRRGRPAWDVGAGIAAAGGGHRGVQRAALAGGRRRPVGTRLLPQARMPCSSSYFSRCCAREASRGEGGESNGRRWNYGGFFL